MTDAKTTATDSGSSAIEEQDGGRATESAPTVKCLVWDLDNTLWDGVLLEDDEVGLRDEAVETIRTLDERGILHSIASKNDHETAMAELERLGLEEYFLYPQISWSSKVESLETIAETLNIGIDALAFVDDRAVEREEVRHSLPMVRCYEAGGVSELVDDEAFNPEFVTDESRMRRKMYRARAERQEVEQEFTGPKESFLETLGMELTISRASRKDLQRAEELTVRTNQLNTTGYTYSYEELDDVRHSDDHDLWVAELDDKFGTYGKIGLALVERGEEAWTIKLFLLSCRVMNRGVGTILLSHLLRTAKAAGNRMRAEFVPNGRNRRMRITYAFAGFEEVDSDGETVVLEHDLSEIQSFPEYTEVRIEHDESREP